MERIAATCNTKYIIINFEKEAFSTITSPDRVFIGQYEAPHNLYSSLVIFSETRTMKEKKSTISALTRDL